MGLSYDCVCAHPGSFSSLIARTAGALSNETLFARHVESARGRIAGVRHRLRRFFTPFAQHSLIGRQRKA